MSSVVAIEAVGCRPTVTFRRSGCAATFGVGNARHYGTKPAQGYAWPAGPISGDRGCRRHLAGDDPPIAAATGRLPILSVAFAAALATACARGLTLLASIYVLAFREKLISLRALSVPSVIDSWRRILHVGLPAAGTRMVVPLVQPLPSGDTLPLNL